jgi:hypothetical protein
MNMTRSQMILPIDRAMSERLLGAALGNPAIRWQIWRIVRPEI